MREARENTYVNKIEAHAFWKALRIHPELRGRYSVNRKSHYVRLVQHVRFEVNANVTHVLTVHDGLAASTSKEVLQSQVFMHPTPPLRFNRS